MIAENDETPGCPERRS